MFDLDVTIHGRTNQCSFIHNDKKVKLMLNQSKPPKQENGVNKDKGKVDTLVPEKKSDKGKSKMVMSLLAMIKLKRV